MATKHVTTMAEMISCWIARTDCNILNPSGSSQFIASTKVVKPELQKAVLREMHSPAMDQRVSAIPLDRQAACSRPRHG